MNEGIRLNLKVEGEPFHVAGSYKTFTPTSATLLENMDELHIAWFFTPGQIRRELPENISGNALRILRLVGYDAGLYVTPPVPLAYDGG